MPMPCGAWRAMASTTDRCGCGGSAAFVAGALGCGLLVDVIAARNLIWVIAAVGRAWRASPASALQPLGDARKARCGIQPARGALLRDPGFLAIIVTSALIQGSHAAYYIFAVHRLAASGIRRADHCQALWSLGVIAEIVAVRAVAALHAAAGRCWW